MLVCDFVSLCGFNKSLKAMDDPTDTRTRFKEELRARIPPKELTRIKRIEESLLDVFTREMIDFAEETKNWSGLLSKIAPGVMDIATWVRIFFLQRFYGDVVSTSPSSHSSTPSSKRMKPIHIRGSDEENSISSDDDSVEQVIYPSPGYRATRKSAPISPRRCYIDTFTVSSDKVVSSFKRMPSSSNIQEIRTTVCQSGEEHKINIKRCSCSYSIGTCNVCECISQPNEYLVPRRVIRSRQVPLTKATELLIEWQPFPHKSCWPNSWVPMEPLAIWSSRVLMDYLIARIEY
jgi:hypothetical protein